MDQGNRMLILIALPIEAKPFIEELGLVRSDDEEGDCYESKEFRLILTGVGPNKATASTRRALSMEKPIAVCNFGVCGSRSKDIDIGEVIYANPIYDYTRGNTYYPDPLIKHGFREGALLTCDRPQADSDTIAVGDALIVDMEAANICGVVKDSIPLHQVQVLKMVSDYLDDKLLKKQFVRDLIMQSMGNILTYFSRLIKVAYELPIFSDAALGKYEACSSKLRLTETQRIKFRRLCLHRISSGDTDLDVLNIFAASFSESKSSRKDIFTNICNELIS